MSRRTLIVAPHAGGHHGEYLRWITRGLVARGAALTVVAPPAALDAAGLDADGRTGHAHLGPEADPVAVDPVAPLSGGPSAWSRSRAVAALTRRTVLDHRPERVLLPYLDPAVPAVAVGMRFRCPVRMVGLLFRVTLHEPAESGGIKAVGRRAAKSLALRAAARNPHLGAVLALDPDAVAPLRRLGLDARWVPDPVEPPSPLRDAAAVRAALGIEPHRRVALLFGSLEERKGVFETLAALPRMSPTDASRLSVVVLGRTYDDIRPRLEAAVADARRTQAQVVFEERFVPDAELDEVVAAADAVLAPYCGHVGSSGVVLRAAAAGTPLVATEEGMVGREVRGHRLGQTIDPARLDALAEALGAVARGETPGFNPDGAAAYAAAHHVDRFVGVIADALSSP